ncbi:MAG: prephenate dehydrogenase [Oscillospiraceae bacterium]|jgi:prephenate dehydrogenase
MTIGIIGLGLIGGSMAKAVKSRTAHRVFAFDRDPAVLNAALTERVCDGVLERAQLKACEIVLVALWPDDTVQFVKQNADAFAPGSIVSDLCGVKGFVCRGVRDAVLRRDFTFVGAHPMAGRERSGFESASAELFDRASMLLTPFPGTPREEIEKLSDFYRTLGFARILETTAEEHDRVIAYTSQLAHIVSSAYVKSPTVEEHHGFSAGSYRDMTRVARLNEDMWTELFLENRAPLKSELDALIARLRVFSQALGENDAGTLRSLLREGRTTKERIDAEDDGY